MMYVRISDQIQTTVVFCEIVKLVIQLKLMIKSRKKVHVVFLNQCPDLNRQAVQYCEIVKLGNIVKAYIFAQ